MDISLKEAIAALALMFGYWKYLDSRKRELKWKRTEFLFSQAQYLDTDPQISKAVAVLAGLDKNFRVDSFFDEFGKLTKADEEYVFGFEKLFNLLDRVAYAYINAKTISKTEVDNFSWYLRAIKKSCAISAYCNQNGFENVVRIADMVER